jgi:hypothetical protein
LDNVMASNPRIPIPRIIAARVVMLNQPDKNLRRFAVVPAFAHHSPTATCRDAEPVAIW